MQVAQNDKCNDNGLIFENLVDNPIYFNVHFFMWQKLKSSRHLILKILVFNTVILFMAESSICRNIKILTGKLVYFGNTLNFCNQ